MIRLVLIALFTVIGLVCVIPVSFFTLYLSITLVCFVRQFVKSVRLYFRPYPNQKDKSFSACWEMMDPLR